MKRKILLNPGPATTTDSVKKALLVPDICPREKEFVLIMAEMRNKLINLVHADPNRYTSVLFCGSGTINMDVAINSLVDEGKKILILNNGAYSNRAVTIAKYYDIDCIELKYKYDEGINIKDLEDKLKKDEKISVVYTTHHETGTGFLNDIKKIGEIVHRYNKCFVVDTTSSLAMIPIDIEEFNIDFCMSSAQKGIMAMSGLSFIIGKKELIEKSKAYKTRSYYCNLYRQYASFEKTGEMEFTPPVQIVYSAIQALKEYFEEGEINKYKRHMACAEELHKILADNGYEELIDRAHQSGLVIAVKYHKNKNWDFDSLHDYCYERGYTIYPGKVGEVGTFRLCTLGAIYPSDMKAFGNVLKNYHKKIGN